MVCHLRYVNCDYSENNLLIMLLRILHYPKNMVCENDSISKCNLEKTVATQILPRKQVSEIPNIHIGKLRINFHQMNLNVFIWVKFRDIMAGGVSQTKGENQWPQI